MDTCHVVSCAPFRRSVYARGWRYWVARLCGLRRDRLDELRLIRRWRELRWREEQLRQQRRQSRESSERAWMDRCIARMRRKRAAVERELEEMS